MKKFFKKTLQAFKIIKKDDEDLEKPEKKIHEGNIHRIHHLANSHLLKDYCFMYFTYADLNYSEKTYLLPLKNLEIKASINGGLARVHLIQKYENPYKEKKLNLTYQFPINSKAIFDSIEAFFKDKRIKGVIKEKETAKAEFEYHKAKGDTVIYAGTDENNADIMKMEIGNLRPGEEITVNFSYLVKLDIIDYTNWSFRVPCTLTPRYNLGDKMFADGLYPEDFNLENRSEGNLVKPDFFDPKKKMFWDVDVRINWPGGPKNVYSTSHFEGHLIDFSPGVVTARFLKPGEEGFIEQFPDKDYELIIEDKDLFSNCCSLAKIPEMETLNKNSPQYAAILQFVPEIYSWYGEKKSKFSGENLKKEEENKGIDIYADEHYDFLMDSTFNEFIFVLDRSGSMSGSRMKTAKDALILFLKSLPYNSLFNVYSFGSNYEKLFNRSVQYTEENIKTAVNKVEIMNANLGGTEILEPLLSIFGEERVTKYQRNIFLLTDGDISNTNSVILTIKKNCFYRSSRVFSIGIGNGCSQDLIERAAKAGGGLSVIVSDSGNRNPEKYGIREDDRRGGFYGSYGSEDDSLFGYRYLDQNVLQENSVKGEDLKSKVISLLNSSLSATLSDFTVEFDRRYISMISPLPDKNSFIMGNQPFTMNVILKNEIEEAENLQTVVKVKYFNSGTQKYETRLFNLSLNGCLVLPDFHKMAIFDFIKTLELNWLNNDYTNADFKEIFGRGFYLEEKLMKIITGKSDLDLGLENEIGAHSYYPTPPKIKERLNYSIVKNNTISFLKKFAVAYQVLVGNYTGFICLVEEYNGTDWVKGEDLEIKNYEKEKEEIGYKGYGSGVYKKRRRRQYQDIDQIQRNITLSMKNVMNRSENIDDLMMKSESLSMSSNTFYKKAKKSKSGFSFGLGGLFGSKASKEKRTKKKQSSSIQKNSLSRRPPTISEAMDDCMDLAEYGSECPPYEGLKCAINKDLDKDLDKDLLDRLNALKSEISLPNNSIEKKEVSSFGFVQPKPLSSNNNNNNNIKDFSSESDSKNKKCDKENLIKLQKIRGNWEFNSTIYTKIWEDLAVKLKNSENLMERLEKGIEDESTKMTFSVLFWLEIFENGASDIFLILKKAGGFLRKSCGVENYNEILVEFENSK